MEEKYMKLAISQAKNGKGNTYTNPLVGAVIVKDTQIIAAGAHLAYGQPHAEKNAIQTCLDSEKLFDSMLYVTLEPCNHQGKQPPCTEVILASGIKEVVIGQLDPNPLVSGKGKERLEKAGIKVVVGVLETEVRQLNRHYNHFFEQKRPYVVLKQAMTLDGKISFLNKRTAITGKEVYQRVRQERSQYQAILVGSETILVDDPTLLPDLISVYPPLRVILDRRGRIFSRRELNIFKSAKAPVIVFTEVVEPIENLPPHLTIIQEKQLTLTKVLEHLTERQIQSIYVEGGAKIHDAFFASGLWDEVICYLSPKLIGGNGISSMSSQRPTTTIANLLDVAIETLGNDIRISGRRG